MSGKSIISAILFIIFTIALAGLAGFIVARQVHDCPPADCTGYYCEYDNGENDLEYQFSILENQLGLYRSQLGILETQIDSINGLKETLVTQVTTLENTIETLSAMLDENGQHAETIALLAEQVVNLNNQILQNNTEIITLETEIAELDETITTLLARIEFYRPQHLGSIVLGENIELIGTTNRVTRIGNQVQVEMRFRVLENGTRHIGYLPEGTFPSSRQWGAIVYGDSMRSIRVYADTGAISAFHGVNTGSHQWTLRMFWTVDNAVLPTTVFSAMSFVEGINVYANSMTRTYLANGRYVVSGSFEINATDGLPTLFATMPVGFRPQTQAFLSASFNSVGGLQQFTAHTDGRLTFGGASPIGHTVRIEFTFLSAGGEL